MQENHSNQTMVSQKEPLKIVHTQRKRMWTCIGNTIMKKGMEISQQPKNLRQNSYASTNRAGSVLTVQSI